jgi:hypothetical protein
VCVWGGGGVDGAGEWACQAGGTGHTLLKGVQVLPTLNVLLDRSAWLAQVVSGGRRTVAVSPSEQSPIVQLDSAARRARDHIYAGVPDMCCAPEVGRGLIVTVWKIITNLVWPAHGGPNEVVRARIHVRCHSSNVPRASE